MQRALRRLRKSLAFIAAPLPGLSDWLSIVVTVVLFSGLGVALFTDALPTWAKAHLVHTGGKVAVLLAVGLGLAILAVYRLLSRIEEQEEARPNLVLEKAVVVPDDLYELHEPTSGLDMIVRGQANWPRTAVAQRCRRVEFARMLICNSPRVHAPTAVARGVNARIRFLDFEHRANADYEVTSGLWMDQSLPCIDFNIGQAHWLEIAFKYNDITVAHALDNRAVRAPKWELPEHLLAGLKGNAWYLVEVHLTGEWVDTKLRCKLRLFRPHDSQAGNLVFCACSEGEVLAT